LGASSPTAAPKLLVFVTHVWVASNKNLQKFTRVNKTGERCENRLSKKCWSEAVQAQACASCNYHKVRF